MVKQHHEKTNGCFEIKKGLPTQYHKHNNINFLTCVCNFYDSSVNTLIDMEDYYDKHGLNDLIYMENYGNTYTIKKEVSSKLMQYFKIIRNFKLEKQIEEQKRAEREYKSKAGIR